MRCKELRIVDEAGTVQVSITGGERGGRIEVVSPDRKSTIVLGEAVYLNGGPGGTGFEKGGVGILVKSPEAACLMAAGPEAHLQMSAGSSTFVSRVAAAKTTIQASHEDAAINLTSGSGGSGLLLFGGSDVPHADGGEVHLVSGKQGHGELRLVDASENELSLKTSHEDFGLSAKGGGDGQELFRVPGALPVLKRD